jgi:hypothetical protein
VAKARRSDLARQTLSRSRQASFYAPLASRLPPTGRKLTDASFPFNQPKLSAKALFRCRFIEAKTVKLAGRRYIICRNHQEVEKDAADRASIVAALERQLARGDKALVGNAGFRRYLKTISKDHFAIDPDKIEEEKKFDGIFVLRSSRPPAPPSTCSRPGRSSTSSTRRSAATCFAASLRWC